MKFSLFLRVTLKATDYILTKDFIKLSIKAGTGGNGISRFFFLIFKNNNLIFFLKV
jgi:hypothetical protein